MQPTTGFGETVLSSLEEQFTALQRERDEAKANEEILKREVARLRSANATKSELMLKSSKEWQQRMDTLKTYLAAATNQLASKAQELELMKVNPAKAQQFDPARLQHDEDPQSIATLRAVAAPTADVVAALKDFLEKNAAITGDGFSGAGRDFDHMRFLIGQISKPLPTEPSNRTSSKNG